ncbi:MAG TPA: hypothetical protein VIY47_11760, partial [Ignavibacteriaceae bacterium]
MPTFETSEDFFPQFLEWTKQNNDPESMIKTGFDIYRTIKDPEIFPVYLSFVSQRLNLGIISNFEIPLLCKTFESSGMELSSKFPKEVKSFLQSMLQKLNTFPDIKIPIDFLIQYDLNLAVTFTRTILDPIHVGGDNWSQGLQYLAKILEKDSSQGLDLWDTFKSIWTHTWTENGPVQMPKSSTNIIYEINNIPELHGLLQHQEIKNSIMDEILARSFLSNNSLSTSVLDHILRDFSMKNFEKIMEKWAKQTTKIEVADRETSLTNLLHLWLSHYYEEHSYCKFSQLNDWIQTAKSSETKEFVEKSLHMIMNSELTYVSTKRLRPDLTQYLRENHFKSFPNAFGEPPKLVGISIEQNRKDLIESVLKGNTDKFIITQTSTSAMELINWILTDENSGLYQDVKKHLILFKLLKCVDEKTQETTEYKKCLRATCILCLEKWVNEDAPLVGLSISTLRSFAQMLLFKTSIEDDDWIFRAALYCALDQPIYKMGPPTREHLDQIVPPSFKEPLDQVWEDME